MSTPIICDPCCYDNKTVEANTWCVECEEGFCPDCQKFHKATKISRSHQLISIDTYRNIQHVTVEQTCIQHNKKFDWFCKSHDEALCKACVSSEHKLCPDVVPLEDVTANAKHSTIIHDLEDTINRSLTNIEDFIRDRNTVSESIQTKRREIEKTITVTREKVVLFFDELQQRLLQELSSISGECISKISKDLEYFEKSQKTLTELKEQTLKLKDFASDLHIFLGTRKIYDNLNEEIESIKLATSHSRSYNIELDFHPIINNLCKEIDKFGKIKLEKCESSLLFYDAKIGQAQMQKGQVKGRVQDIVLQLDKQLNLQKQDNVIYVYGCMILPSGQILITNSHNKTTHIQEYTENGIHTRNITTSFASFDLSSCELDCIAVSCGIKKHIDLIKNGSVEKTLKLEFKCFGLAYSDRKLYVTGETKEIVVIDLSGKRIGEVKCKGFTRNITTSGTRIYYTSSSQHSVYCCTMDGTEIWTFNDDSLRYPTALSLDKDQNVFVVGSDSNNLVVIQHDGKASKILLNKDDLLKPNAVYYSKETNSLLVCDLSSGNAALYNVA